MLLYFLYKQYKFIAINIMFVRITSTPKSPRKSVKVVASIREGLKVRQHVGIASNEAEIEKLKRSLDAELLLN